MLSAELYPSYFDSAIVVSGVVNKAPAKSPVYLVVDDHGDIFGDRPADISWSTPTTFQAVIYPNPEPSIGLHAGSFDLRMCGDAECRDLLGTVNIPYSIQVKPPNPVFLGAADDAFGGVAGGRVWALAVIEGAAFSPVHARVVDGGGVFEPGTWLYEASGLDQYQLLLPLVATLEARQYAGTIAVEFCQDAACGVAYGTQDLDFRLQVFEEFAAFRASDLAVDADGNLWGTELGDPQRLLRVTPDGVTTTEYSAAAVDQPVLAHLAIDPAGNVYVGSHGLLRRSPDGTLSPFSSDYVSAIATDAAGNLWSTSYPLDHFTQRAADGSILRDEVFREDEPISAIAVDAEDLYVSTAGGIWRVAPDGTQALVNDLQAIDLARQSAGTFVAATEYRSVWRFDAGAAQTIAPGLLYLGDPLEAWLPHAVAVSPNGSVLFVADSTTGVVLRTTLALPPG